ncbi:MAG: virB8 family protein [Burkholderiales bacterium]|nr:virB8 family protein [Burkholderiales bacterium]
MSDATGLATSFFAKATDWETDQILQSKKRERRAWWFAIAGWLLAIMAVAAVMFLTPLKSVEPFVVRVDQATGAVDIVTRLNSKDVKFDEVVNKYWIARYVNYREEYSAAMAYPDYLAVGLMSTRPVADQYFELVRPENPKAPLNVYKNGGTVEVLIRSVSFLENNVAQVRFDRIEKTSIETTTTTHWIATLTYRYVSSPMAEKDRLVNPLGFQVVDYRLDSENIPTGK